MSRGYIGRESFELNFVSSIEISSWRHFSRAIRSRVARQLNSSDETSLRLFWQLEWNDFVKGSERRYQIKNGLTSVDFYWSILMTWKKVCSYQILSESHVRNGPLWTKFCWVISMNMSGIFKDRISVDNDSATEASSTEFCLTIVGIFGNDFIIKNWPVMSLRMNMLKRCSIYLSSFCERSAY